MIINRTKRNSIIKTKNNTYDYLIVINGFSDKPEIENEFLYNIIKNDGLNKVTILIDNIIKYPSLIDKSNRFLKLDLSVDFKKNGFISLKNRVFSKVEGVDQDCLNLLNKEVSYILDVNSKNISKNKILEIKNQLKK